MGTDIHTTFQAKRKLPAVGNENPEDISEWEDIPGSDVEIDNYSRWGISRHYLLFAVLADVRNGFGFAGTETHIPLVPISEPHGCPDDFEPNEYDWYHSTSWLSGEEMMAWFNGDSINIVSTGIIDKATFDTWDGNDPESYCGNIFGDGIVIGSDPVSFFRVMGQDADISQLAAPINENTTHVRVHWQTNVQSEVAYFFNAVQKLIEKYGEIRLVMGFDS